MIIMCDFGFNELKNSCIHYRNFAQDIVKSLPKGEKIDGTGRAYGKCLQPKQI